MLVLKIQFIDEEKLAAINYPEGLFMTMNGTGEILKNAGQRKG
jgi:hypothetical protein